MKTLLTTLFMITLAFCTAYAQTKSCGVKQNQVCRVSKDKRSVSCYKTTYAENFTVCKGEHNYFICCQAQSRTNTTAKRTYTSREVNYVERPATITSYSNSFVNTAAPQNQSYANTSHGTYVGNSKKSCYVGDNVAENNRAPYKGCSSPQSDGPEANNQRNLNVNNSSSLNE